MTVAPPRSPRALFLAAAALALGVPTACAADCAADADCAAAACAARGAVEAICRAATCYTPLHRCRCPGAAALRRDGGCDPAVAVSEDALVCSDARSSADVVFAVAMWSERAEYRNSTGPADLASPYGTILWRSLAAAVGAPPERVVVTSVAARTEEGDLQQVAGSAGIVAFDWSVAFCIANASSAEAPLLPVDPADFEHRFQVTAQEYEAFAQATLRILQFRQPEITAAPTAGGGGGDAALSEPAPPEVPTTGAGGLGEYWWLFWGLAAVVALLALPAAWILLRRRRRRLKAAMQRAREDEEESSIADFLPGPRGSMLRWRVASLDPEHGEASLAMASSAFSGVQEVEQDDPFADGCMDVVEGDVVEVLAVGDGWLYGRAAQAPDRRVGFLPERCVQWLGAPATAPGAVASPLPEAAPAAIDIEIVDPEDGGGAAPRLPPPQPAAGAWSDELRGPAMAVARAFSPEEVTAADPDFRRQCLTLHGGERVELLAAGGGWVYARVQGSVPELLGYAPADRLTAEDRGHHVGDDGAGAMRGGTAAPDLASIQP